PIGLAAATRMTTMLEPAAKSNGSSLYPGLRTTFLWLELATCALLQFHKPLRAPDRTAGRFRLPQRAPCRRIVGAGVQQGGEIAIAIARGRDFHQFVISVRQMRAHAGPAPVFRA